MKSEIEKQLKPLIGKRLTRSNRTLNIECIQFGDLTKIKDGEVGEIAIHITCDWRIVGDKLYVGSKDIDFLKSGTYDNEIDWDLETYRDYQLNGLITNCDLVVDTVTADNFGGFQIDFQNGMKLQVLPMTSSQDWVNEYWRTFRPNKTNEEHFVITSRGIQ